MPSRAENLETCCETEISAPQPRELDWTRRERRRPTAPNRELFAGGACIRPPIATAHVGAYCNAPPYHELKLKIRKCATDGTSPFAPAARNMPEQTRTRPALADLTENLAWRRNVSAPPPLDRRKGLVTLSCLTGPYHEAGCTQVKRNRPTCACVPRQTETHSALPGLALNLRRGADRLTDFFRLDAGGAKSLRRRTSTGKQGQTLSCLTRANLEVTVRLLPARRVLPPRPPPERSARAASLSYADPYRRSELRRRPCCARR